MFFVVVGFCVVVVFSWFGLVSCYFCFAFASMHAFDLSLTGA